MRILIAIGLLIAVALLMASILVEFLCDLCRHSSQVPPDLHGSGDWDIEVDEFADAIPPVASYTEQLTVDRYRDPRTLGDDGLRDSNALDDLRSAL
jgi:hypothetical protein